MLGASTNASGLVGHWTFDGAKLTTATATDSSGNGFDAELSTNRPTKGIGKIGQALVFNGTNNQVNVPYYDALAPTSAVSFGAWFKTTDFSSLQRIVTKAFFGGYGLELNPTLSAIVASVNVTGANNGASTTTYPFSSLSTNKWYHAFATYDGTTLKLYINGVLVSSRVVGGSIAYTYNNYLCIAASTNSNLCNGGGNRFAGSLDDVRVYNRALSASEVQALYKQGGK